GCPACLYPADQCPAWCCCWTGYCPQTKTGYSPWEKTAPTLLKPAALQALLIEKAGVCSLLEFCSWHHHRISWTQGNVLFGIFTLDNFLVLKLEPQQLSLFCTQHHNAVALGKRSEPAGLCDQLQDAGLRIQRITARPEHLAGDKSFLAVDLRYCHRDLGVIEETFQFIRDHVLDLQRGHAADFDLIDQRQRNVAVCPDNHSLRNLLLLPHVDAEHVSLT